MRSIHLSVLGVLYMRVFIDGRQGTTGLKIYDRLKQRSDIQILNIKESLRKDPKEKHKIMQESDIIFLCLPDDAARESVQLAKDCNAKIIDTSTAHRTNENFSYGFAELSKEHFKGIQENKYIAVPGCHASGFIALVYPLIRQGILPKDYPFSMFSLTGYSGGGKKMIQQYEEQSKDILLNSPGIYATAQQHKHLKEMKAVTGISSFPIFLPTVGDFYSGMLVSVPIYTSMLEKKVTLENINEIFMQHYKDDPVVKAELPENDSMLYANAMANKDSMQVFALGNDERIVLYALYDNLGKGASGAAIECMNIASGIDKTKGLIL